MNRLNNIKTKKQSGFTLIEVMVSVTLFAIVMTMSLGAILSIIDGNKKAQAINSVANNLNFAVESMVRDIKTGYAYTCGSNNNHQDISLLSIDASSNIGSGRNGCDPSSASDNISLISTIPTATATKRSVKYFLNSDDGRIYKVTSDNPASAYPVTSPEVKIQTLSFYVDNPITQTTDPTTVGQPKVFLIIKGTASVNPTQTSDFTIQTLISQRNLNLPK